MLTDPRDALGEEGSLAPALVGLAGLAHLVRALASGAPAPAAAALPPRATGDPADDLVDLLLGVAALGGAATALAAPGGPASAVPAPPARAWLR